MKKETGLKRLHIHNFLVIFTGESYLAEIQLSFVLQFSCICDVLCTGESLDTEIT